MTIVEALVKLMAKRNFTIDRSTDYARLSDLCAEAGVNLSNDDMWKVINAYVKSHGTSKTTDAANETLLGLL